METPERQNLARILDLYVSVLWNSNGFRWILAIVYSLMLISNRSFGVISPCGECDGWNCVATGSVNDPGKLSNTNDIVICVGSSASFPSISAPTFNNGQKTRDCRDRQCNTTTTTNSIGYIATNWWEPQIPDAFTNCGTFNFTAKVRGLSYDGDCPDPTATVDVGTITVKAVGVASATASGATAGNDGDNNPDTQVYVTCVGTGDVTVSAASCPGLSEQDIPSCWITTGGSGTNKLTRTVTKTNCDSTTVTFTAGTSSKSVTVSVVKTSLGTDKIWWFNGESPSGYTMQTSASVCGARNGATFAWSVSGPAEIVGVSTNSSITIKGTGPSVSQNDVTVIATVDGVTICPTNLTVLAPQSLNWLSNNDQTVSGGYNSEIHYQILDQFGQVLPSNVPWNEDIDANGAASTATQVTTSAIPDPDVPGEDWIWGAEFGWNGGWIVDPNNAYDNVGKSALTGADNPQPLSPQTPLTGIKIDHSPSGGAWYVGTTGDGGIGVKVKTLKWQRYLDHGRHE